MKRFLLIAVVISLLVLSASCGNGEKSIASDKPMQSADKTINKFEYDGKTLMFQTDGNQCEVLSVTSDENGYAAVYAETFSMPEMSREENYIKVQFFNEDGSFVLEGNTKFLILKDDFKEIENERLTDTDFSF